MPPDLNCPCREEPGSRTGSSLADARGHVRNRSGARRDRAAPVHDLLGRPDHVLRAVAGGRGRPGPVVAAGRYFRCRGDPGRGDPCVRGEAPGCGHPGGLRPVRDREHHHLQRQCGAAQSAVHRQAHLGSGGPGGRRAGQGASPGPGEYRRDRHPRPQRDEGVLPAVGGDRRGVLRWLVPHRRPGLCRRGRLPVHRRPQRRTW